MGYCVEIKPPVSSIPYEIFEHDIIRGEKIMRYKFHSNDVAFLKFNAKPIITALEEYINSADSSVYFAFGGVCLIWKFCLCFFAQKGSRKKVAVI